MKIYTAVRETGAIIEECRSIKKAKECIAEYEWQDKINDVYSEDCYCIIKTEGETA